MIAPARSALLAVVILLSASSARAYEVTPMIYDLNPTGKEATTVIRAHNTNASPITIELVAEKRMFDENGAETRAPADNDFVLFPPQAVVQPGVSQALRVQYVGPTDLAKSVMYTITVKQIPIKMPAETARGVQFVFNFSTVANVVPRGAKPQIDTVSLVPAGDTLRLTIRNSGNRYANLALSSVALEGTGFSTIIKDDAWRKALGASWILPDGTRVISLPKPPGSSAAALHAKVNFVDVTL
jgi:fimbrial chaperone protein